VKDVRGRVAVVTGAASGIGRALAAALAERGAAVALVDRDACRVEAAAHALELGGATVSWHEADVADRAAMEALPDEIVARHGAVHLLVNNAGVSVAARLIDHAMDDFDFALDVNLRGVAHGCRFFLPHLLRADLGHIVNLSSLAGLVAFPGQTAYCASKFAVRGLTEALAVELASTRVRVTGVYPGTVRTDILRSSRFSDPAAQALLVDLMERHGLPPERVAARVLRAVARREREVVVGWDAHLLVWLHRLAPPVGRLALGALFDRLDRRG
jgi:NADP-dependent 3-hydroxy acid dehydrogenase YdfG